MKKIMLKMLIFIIIAFFIYGCEDGIESNASFECPKHDCKIGMKQCESDVDNLTEWLEGNRGYFEWYCKNDSAGCGRWMSAREMCNLTDLAVSGFAYGFGSSSAEVGEMITLQAIVEIRGPAVPENLDISFYVNVSACNSYYDCVLKPSNDINFSPVFNSEFIEMKNKQVTGISPSYIQSYSHEGLHYAENGMLTINSSYKIKTPGYYYFYVILDEDNKIIEANEKNNEHVLGWGHPVFIPPTNYLEDMKKDYEEMNIKYQKSLLEEPLEDEVFNNSVESYKS